MRVQTIQRRAVATAALYDRADALPPAWDAAVGPSRTPLSRAYLAALEATCPPGVALRYALLDAGAAPAAAVIQRFAIDALAIRGLAERLPAPLAALARRARFDVVACGNLFLAGDHGVALPVDACRATVAAALLDALDAIAAREGATTSLVKDVADPALGAALEAAGLHRHVPEPTMAIAIDPAWRGLDDYLAALRARYRHQLRRARKDGAALERRTLDAAAIERAAPRLAALYAPRLARSPVALPTVGVAHFAALADALPGAFELVAYLEDGDLVGFNTRLRRGDVLESWLIGYDDDANRRRAIYRNAVLDDVEHAIATGGRAVELGRTALAIKAALGARPASPPWFYRHRERAGDALLRALVACATTTAPPSRRAFR